MNIDMIVRDGKPMVSSKQVSDYFNKEHRNTMRDIRKTSSEAGDFGALNFVLSSYTSLQNKELPCYWMTKDGFSLLAMGFTGREATEWKVMFIETFNQMEKMLLGQTSVMGRLNDAIKLMEQDKGIASGCGKGLSEWRKVRQKHIDAVESLQRKAQLLLDFK